MREAAIKPCVGLVDDDESLCRSLTRLLRASGIDSVTYASAEDFLEDAERARFDCLILDIQLGGMSGIECRDRLSESGLTLPVIFLTAYDEPETRERALGGRCIAYMRKSDSGSALLAAIDRAIRGKREPMQETGKTP